MAGRDGARELLAQEGDHVQLASDGADEARPRFRRMVVDVLKLAIPNIASYVLTLLNEVTNTLFIGKTGDEAELAAVGLGNMMQNCLGLSIGIGFAMALDTFVSQAHGAGEGHLCAHYLQRCRVIVTLQLVWMVPVLWYSEDILVAIGQDHDVARHAGSYNRVSMFGLFSVFQFEATKRFLTNQTYTKGPAAILGVCSLLHVVWCLIFIWHLRLGNAGAGYANVTTWSLTFVIGSIYLCWVAPELRLSRWALLGVQKPGFQGLGRYLQVAVPSTIQLCSEWWFWEICALVVGYLGKVALAAHVSTGNLLSVAFMPAIGIQVSAATLVGNMLGANQPRKARYYTWACSAFAFATWTLMALFMVFGRSIIAAAYTNEEKVQQVMETLLCIFALAGFFDATQNVMGGALRGMGRSQAAAIVYLVAYFGVMLPLGCILAFPLKLGVYGMWWSFVAGTAGAMAVFIVMLSRARWPELAIEASERMQREGVGQPSAMEVGRSNGAAPAADGSLADKSP